jgi:hypothetical protein
MKKTLLSLSVILSSITCFAQFEGFENWTQNQIQSLEDYETSANEGQQNTQQSTDAHTGLYSVKLEVMQLPGGDTTFGYFISGNPDDMSPGQQVTLNNVDSVVGYYKADFQSGDSALFIAMTTFMGTPTGGGAFYITQSQSNWTRFAFYVGAIAADSLMIGAANGDPLNEIRGVLGSWVMFDDIQLKSSTGVTQNILNNSFENWTPVVWDEIDGWNTTNEWYIGEPLMPVVKTTDAYTGNFAVELNTFIDSRGDTSWSQVTNGIFGENQMEGGVPFSGNPTSVEFYYKYTPVGNDTAYFNIEFKKTGLPSQWGGTNVTNAASSYSLNTNFLPFLNSPDSILIVIHSGRNPGTQLKVDDINFIFPVGVSEIVDVEKIVAYPNPVKEVLNIRFNLKAEKDIKIRLVDITGKQLNTLDFGSLSVGTYNQMFNVSNFSSGVYFIEFLIDGEKKVERFVVE